MCIRDRFATVQSALSQLQQITQGKLQQLLSCEMEVRRQLQEMDAAEALLQEQRTAMEPVQFCAAWARHQLLREQLRTTTLPLIAADVDAPITIQGEIKPISTALSPARLAHHRPPALPDKPAAATPFSLSALDPVVPATQQPPPQQQHTQHTHTQHTQQQHQPQHTQHMQQ
eukprot:TRINITY_DN8492_c0_g1_i5.p1 TRINITY_DN8492_c0_g1~~TRINITY_DN8492_c0_g1_i5.p1  ORF type:complete len:172 (-),score=69.44 TRINITY_DN8492_c0_g1_i5:700-1215(-)